MELSIVKNWLKSDSQPFKNDKQYYLFHLKSSFRPQGIEIFVLNFCSCRKHGLVTKIRLIFIVYNVAISLTKNYIHMLPNISGSKRNQTMKFVQVIKYNKRKTFLQKSRGKLRKKTSFRPLFFFWKRYL